MWQLELAYISIQGWVIDSDQYCFFDGSGSTMVLPAHYTEVVQRHLMTSDVVIVYDGRWCSHVLPELSPKVLPHSSMYSSQSTLPHLYL